jgi:hypothetical protein
MRDRDSERAGRDTRGISSMWPTTFRPAPTPPHGVTTCR